jgi:hypothetical protein
MFHAMAQYQNAVFSPNEYFDSLTGGIGSIGRYKLAMKYYYKYTDIKAKVVIGEYGLAQNYDPHKGYRKAGISSKDYANALITQFQNNYLLDGTNVCVFSKGTWQGFEIDDVVFSILAAYNNTLETIPNNPKPTPPIDKDIRDERIEQLVRIINNIKLNLDEYDELDR